MGTLTQPANGARKAILWPLFFESGLVFVALYLLWQMTVLVGGLEAAPPDLLRLGAAAIPLALALRLGQSTRQRFSGSPHQEIVISAVLNLGLACVSAAVILMVYGVRGITVAAVLAEGAVALPLVSEAGRIVAVRLRLPGFTQERILVYGEDRLANQVVRHITDHTAGGFTLVGFISDKTDAQAAMTGPVAMLPQQPGGIESLTPSEVDRIVVAMKEKRGRLPVQRLLDLRVQGVQIEDYNAFLERSSGRISVDSLLPSALIFSDGFRSSPLLDAIKRLLDFALSLVLLVLASPLMLLTAFLVKLDSRGPVFYTQIRSGKDGAPFRMIKFRSMVPDAEKGRAIWAQEDDPRVTRVGYFIRKYRIDELPQIINVLRGEMSFVGPRPERPEFVRQLEEEIPFYTLRKYVRPGLTGWAQVKYRYGASSEDTLEKLKYDLFYIKMATPLMDLWICLFTIKVVLLGSGAR